MLKFKIISKDAGLVQEFERCCDSYHSLHFVSAWCGYPRNFSQYTYLKNVKGGITATIGYQSNLSHPDGIKELLDLKVDLRLFKSEEGFFHPKMYFFSRGERIALLLGSSNFSYPGFFDNIEANILLEGVPNNEEKENINNLLRDLDRWRKDDFSFVPTKRWLDEYRGKYQATRKREKKSRVESEASRELEEMASVSWLKSASWNTYCGQILQKFSLSKKVETGYFTVLEKAGEELSLPWEVSYFDSIEKRRLLNGTKSDAHGYDYGYLGHVGASGSVRSLFASADIKTKRRIVSAINNICRMNTPMNWIHLEKLLNQLTDIGPTMKVWGRILTLVRPGLYCTISSESVRSNLSKMFNVSKSAFVEPEGYIQLIKMIHASPWFNSSQPLNKRESEIWKCRVALMDAIFYE